MSLTLQAACLVNADRRWVITGTPIQNSLDDLFRYALYVCAKGVRVCQAHPATCPRPLCVRGVCSLVKFIRVKPLDDLATWHTVFSHALKQHRQDAYRNLTVCLQARCARDTAHAR